MMFSSASTHKKRVMASVAVLALFAVLACLPGTSAFAESSGSNGSTVFSDMILTIRDLVNTVFLPIAIVVCGWKIIYLALFCGILGVDPFNEVPDTYSLQWDAIMTLIKQRLAGFFKGMLWIAGIFIVFNLVIAVVSILATQIDALF